MRVVYLHAMTSKIIIIYTIMNFISVRIDICYHGNLHEVTYIHSYFSDRRSSQSYSVEVMARYIYNPHHALVPIIMYTINAHVT